MQKDNVHYGGWEHRDVHNINGMLYVRRYCTKKELLTKSFFGTINDVALLSSTMFPILRVSLALSYHTTCSASSYTGLLA